jgi:hypothetical protein
MAQNQQQSQQQQWQGTERRQSLGPYQGADRRRPSAPVAEPSPDDGTRPMRTQERKDEQEERARRQQRDQTDIH